MGSGGAAPEGAPPVSEDAADPRRIPYRYEPDATAAGLHERHAGLDPGSETDHEVTVAGRLMLRRAQGKLDVRHAPGRHGTHPAVRHAGSTPDYEAFGDLVWATGSACKGVVMTTGAASCR